MLIAVVTSSLGDVALKKGIAMVPAAPSIADVPHAILSAMGNRWLVAGIVLMVVHFAAFVRALRLAALSLVVPLRSMTYVFTALMAQYFLHEQVTPVRWLGILIILLGVSMVGFSGGEK